MFRKGLTGALISLLLFVQYGLAAPSDFIAGAPTASQLTRAIHPAYFIQLRELRHELEEQEAVSAMRHTVVRGETLSMIAKRYGVSLVKLISMNKIKNPDIIYSGQVLVLSLTENLAADTPTGQIYTVLRGDTIWGLAKRYNVNIQSIITANNISDPRALEVGQQLTIPDAVITNISTSRVVASRSIPAANSLNSYTVSATAYCSGTAATGCPIDSRGYSVCTGSSADGITAMGIRAIAGDGTQANPHLVAVDPRMFSLGSLLYIEGYGYAVAADTGGAIKGYRMDVLFSSHQAALQFGRRQLQVTRIRQE